MASVDVTICSQALQLLGAGGIQDFTTTKKGVTASTFYTPVTNALLGEYPWTFARSKRQLSRLVDAPDAHWDYAYTIPAEQVGPLLAVYASEALGASVFKGWVRQGGTILSNATDLWIDQTERAAEAVWPVYFVQLCIFEMAWQLAMPVTESLSKMDAWRSVARGSPAEGGKGGYFQIASNADARGSLSPRLSDFSLIDARMGGLGY